MLPTKRARVGWFFLLFSCALFGCTDPEPAVESPPTGGEGEACYPNSTCDAGLICLSDLCVMPPASQDMGAAEDMRQPGDDDLGTPPEDMSTTPADMSDNAPDMNMVSDMAVDMSAPPEDMGSDSDMSVELQEVAEQESNNGATVDDFNVVAPGQVITGALSTPGDIDIFMLDAQAGRAYAFDLVVDSPSELRGHLTVLDGGRDGDGPGNDYVKIGIDTQSQGAQMKIFAMGEGGYLLIVRDRRAVGSDQMVGGAGFTYRLEVREIDLGGITGATLSPPQTLSDQLDGPSSVRVYPFSTAAEAEEWRISLTANAAPFDGRLHVFSQSTGDWIARNDTGPMGNDPLVDAPLFATGLMYLVVENITPEATVLGYSLSASKSP